MTRKIALILMAASAAFAQRTLDYDHSVVMQTRIDLRDLGYHPADIIPADESAIRALTVAPDGTLFGATSGKRSHLFLLRPVHGFVQPLGYLKGVSAVRNALAVARNGDVYIGGDNGHLLKYVSDGREESRRIRTGEMCETADMGAAVEGQGIRALAIDRARDAIYGVTEPDGHFFRFKIAGGTFESFGRVAEHRIPGEKFENWKNIGRAIGIDAAGNAYVSGEDGAIWRFDPAAGKLAATGLTAPTVKGRQPYNGVDAWTAPIKGALYGGTSDGYLFRLDTSAMRVENLGKPLNQYRIRGLAAAPNGLLYGAGGDDDEMARLFSYDPRSGVYEMLGMIDVSRRPYYAWQAYVVDAMAMGADGVVYIGQSERKSRLYLYYPAATAR